MPEPVHPAHQTEAKGRASQATLIFFAAAFGITWALQLPAVLAQRGLIPGPVEAYLLPAGLGAFGPLPAALLAARWEQGPGSARALFRPLRNWRVGATWWLVALALPGAILVVGMAVYTLFGAHDANPWLYPPTNTQQILALLLIPVAEEIGWRGFALPRLQARIGALAASLVLGVFWTLWHFPVFLLAGIAPSTFSWMFPFFIAGSVVFTWLYNRGGLWLAVLAHMGAHLNNSHHTLPGNITPLVVHTVGFCIVALAVVLLDRGAFNARRALPTP